MPEICFYEPWTYQLSLPEKIEAYLKFAKKKRISYEAEDCSRYNTRTNGKSAKLHPPTLAAIFKLFGINSREFPTTITWTPVVLPRESVKWKTS